jgi:hypothetical protein
MFRSAILLSLLALKVNGQDAINSNNATDPCTLCQNLATPDLEPVFKFFTTSETTCSDAAGQLAAGEFLQGDDECKNLQLLSFQIGCCEFPPFEYCTVCPDGSDFERDTVVPTGVADPPTCATMQYQWSTLNGVFTEGVCSDTLLQRGAHYCGCPDVEQQCFVCEDESPVGNPNKGDAFQTQSTCRGIEYLYSLFTADECDDVKKNYGVDLGAFCECPGTSANYTECELCPDGGEVTNPDATWTDAGATFQRTCAQAVKFASVITAGGDRCDGFMEKARETCNCASGAFGWNLIVSFMLAGALVIKAFL